MLCITPVTSAPLRLFNRKGLKTICPFCRSQIGSASQFPCDAEPEEERLFDAEKYVVWRFNEKIPPDGKDPVTSLNYGTFRRWTYRKRILTVHQADWLAVKSGAHPCEIWSNWFEPSPVIS